MKDWVKRVVTSFVFLGLMGAVFVVSTAADDPKVPFLPGITVADDHPNGCVDCHKNNGPDQDYRLNVSLAGSGHVDISKIVKTIPQDCSMCHKPKTDAGPLSLQTHQAHYQRGMKTLKGRADPLIWRGMDL